MKRQGFRWKGLSGAIVLVSLSTVGFAQEKPVSDAQIEANVLKALASAPELQDQTIGSTTVYGTVTLSGSVQTEALRDKAEQVVANTAGVKKVVDELVVGAPDQTPAVTGVAQSPEDSVGQAQQGAPQSDPAASGAPEPSYPSNSPQNPESAQSYPPQGVQGPPPVQGTPAPIERSQDQQPPDYPSANQPPYQYPNQQANQYPNQQAGPQYPPQRQPYRVQQAGQPVVVPAGTMLRVRINQAMDSRHTQPGAPFDGVVLNDVYSADMIAIPRGAQVQGHVSETQPGGDLRGRGGIALELTQVTLEGHAYPLATESWAHQGYDKTGQTVGTTVGLGAVGATIGAIAGGGPGALLGAGIGAVAGLGASSLSHQGEATVPSEAIVSFRLSQQTALSTVSQAELNRLGAGLPPPPAGPQMMRRRYYGPPPPPPPYYYGPAYYPSPYYYPYYR